MTGVLTDERWAVLDPAVRPTDPKEYLGTALEWHFGADTGSRFWLERAKTLDFDPIRDVRGYGDLSLFPNVVDELRGIPVEDLVPRGYGPHPPAPKVFETGGTTGAPKRVILMPDWFESSIDRMLAGPVFAGRAPGNILIATPTGPHKIGGQYDDVVKKQNTIKFSIDVDPRWVKKLISRGEQDQVRSYVEHVLDQIEHVLETQRVGLVVITPPILRACSGRPRLVELINTKVAVVFWGGAHMTADERFELSQVHFPQVRMVSRYNSAMILEGAAERVGTGAGDQVIYDPYTPVVMFRVVDPETGETVDYGRRGQVVMSHVSKGMFLPNNLERDSAVRVRGPEGQFGDSVADPRPVEKFGGERVIEGIY